MICGIAAVLEAVTCFFLLLMSMCVALETCAAERIQHMEAKYVSMWLNCWCQLAETTLFGDTKGKQRAQHVMQSCIVLHAFAADPCLQFLVNVYTQCIQRAGCSCCRDMS
jgi:hypothetical protein